MIDRLMARAEAAARTAQRRRLEDIAAGVRARGVAAEVGSDSVISRGKHLVQRWLSDPALRFVGRTGS